MGDSPAGIGRRDGLVNDLRRLLWRIDSLSVETNVAEKKVGLGCLNIIGSLELAGHITGERQNRRMVATCLIKTGNQMRASGTRRAGTYRKPASELGLTGGGQRGSFLMAHADPLDLAFSNRVSERIQRVANQSEYVLNASLFQYAHQELSNRLGHSFRSCSSDARASPSERQKSR